MLANLYDINIFTFVLNLKFFVICKGNNNFVPFIIWSKVIISLESYKHNYFTKMDFDRISFKQNFDEQSSIIENDVNTTIFQHA